MWCMSMSVLFYLSLFILSSLTCIEDEYISLVKTSASSLYFLDDNRTNAFQVQETCIKDTWNDWLEA